MPASSLFFNGPESFTPDDRYLLGEAPEVRDLFVAAGFNSIGIQSAGGAGKVLARLDPRSAIRRWISWDVDIRRVHALPGATGATCTTARSKGSACSMRCTGRSGSPRRRAARGASPLHDRLAAAGACFGETAGWERAELVRARRLGAALRVPLRPAELVRRLPAAEHAAVREQVGLFDQTSFAKFLVQGPRCRARC